MPTRRQFLERTGAVTTAAIVGRFRSSRALKVVWTSSMKFKKSGGPASSTRREMSAPAEKMPGVDDRTTSTCTPSAEHAARTT